MGVVELEGKDIQNEVVESVPLKRVGLVNIKFPIIISRPIETSFGSKLVEREVIVNANLYLVLPMNQRGAHMSRLVQALQENLEIPKESFGIEKLALEIALDIKNKSPYASLAEVELSAERPFINDVYQLFGYGNSNGEMRVGVQVTGATCCPCSAEMCEGKAHNQRAIIRIDVVTDGSIPAESLVSVAYSSFSEQTHLMLKREMEKVVVLRMHRNTKFVEDSVRSAVELLRDFKINWCRVECKSLESIHPYDAYGLFEGQP